MRRRRKGLQKIIALGLFATLLVCTPVSTLAAHSEDKVVEHHTGLQMEGYELPLSEVVEEEAITYRESLKKAHSGATSEYAKYTNDYFYGSSGLPVDDQKVYDSKHPAIVGTIKQPNTPNFIQPTFKLLLATITSTKLTVEWQITTNTCPCYEYIITIQQSSNSQYKTIHTYTTSRPEQKTYTYTSSFKGTYKIGVKANAISGTQVYKEITKTI